MSIESGHIEKNETEGTLLDRITKKVEDLQRDGQQAVVNLLLERGQNLKEAKELGLELGDVGKLREKLDEYYDLCYKYHILLNASEQELRISVNEEKKEYVEKLNKINRLMSEVRNIDNLSEIFDAIREEANQEHLERWEEKNL